MLHPSTKKLIDKLSEMTRKQRVAWVEGEGDTVVLDTEGYRVILEGAPHRVVLTDPLGREIETCQPEDFDGETDAQGRPYAQFVAELYREASRFARGTEKAIRTLLAGLDSATTAGSEVVTDLPAPDALADDTVAGEDESAMRSAVATMADQVNEPVAPAEDDAPLVTAPHSGPETGAHAEPTEPAAPEVTLSEEDVAEDAQPALVAHEPIAEPVLQPASEPAEPEPQPALEAGPVEPPAQKPAEQAAEPSPPPQHFSLSGIPYAAMRHAGTPSPAVTTETVAPPAGAADAGSTPAPVPDAPAAETITEPAVSEAQPAPEPEAEPPAPPRIVIDGTADLPAMAFDPVHAEETMDGQSASQDDSGNPAEPPAPPRPFNPWN